LDSKYLTNAKISYTITFGYISERRKYEKRILYSLLIPYRDPDKNYPVVFFDTNGFKGPNKVGYDVFSFNIRRNDDSGVMFLHPGNITACLPAPEENSYFKTTEDIWK
jgi:hypothetical protein